MGKTLWFETIDGDLVDNYDIAKAVHVILGKRIYYTDFDEIRKISHYLPGISKEIENPSVGLFINKGLKVQAVKFYREKYGYDLKDAIKKVKEEHPDLRAVIVDTYEKTRFNPDFESSQKTAFS